MALIMENITKQYSNVKALDNVTITFPNNQIIGLIGFNGSGKTTSFNILSHLLEKYNGNVYIDDDGEKRKLKRHDRIKFSYLSAGAEPQNSETVINQLNYIGALHGLSKKEVLNQISDVVKVLGFESMLKKPIKSLSKGNQQKIKLAASFINPHTKYLLLDEPFDGLDPIMVEKIKNYIMSKKEGLTVIITSHRMDIVDKMCDSFFILKDGVLVDSKSSNPDDKTVHMIINKEVPEEFIKTIPGVIDVTKTSEGIIALIKSIGDFKNVNKKLISHDKYVWSSLKEKRLTESVFERYANE